jgi:hypothetical protein
MHSGIKIARAKYMIQNGRRLNERQRYLVNTKQYYFKLASKVSLYFVNIYGRYFRTLIVENDDNLNWIHAKDRVIWLLFLECSYEIWNSRCFLSLTLQEKGVVYSREKMCWPLKVMAKRKTVARARKRQLKCTKVKATKSDGSEMNSK